MTQEQNASSMVKEKVNVAVFCFCQDVSNSSENNDKGKEPVDKTADKTVDKTADKKKDNKNNFGGFKSGFLLK